MANYTIPLPEKIYNNSLVSIEENNRIAQIEAEFKKQFGDNLTSDQRASLRSQLDEASKSFESRYIDIDSRDYGQNVSFTSSSKPKQIAYGYTRLSGLISFVNANQGDSGAFLHLVITYAGHSIAQVEKLFLDGTEIPFNPANVDAQGRKLFGSSTNVDGWQDLVFLSAISRGETGQSTNWDLLGQAQQNFPTLIDSNFKQSGNAYIYMFMRYAAYKFINGFPEIAIEGFWKNDIFDPRTNARNYTDNAALIIADYLTNSDYGLGFDYSEIDTATLIEAANICEETIALNGGGSERRYVICGSFECSSSDNHARLIKEFEDAIAGDVVYSGNKWFILPGKWRGVSKSLDESNLVTDLSIDVKPSKSDIFNAVKGKYLSSETLWQTSEYPGVKNSYYASLDGEILWEDIDLPWSYSSARCQRIAKILLEDARQWVTFTAEFDLAAYSLRPGDVIEFTYLRLGWANKQFRVLGRDKILKENGSISIKLTLKETAAAIYDWSTEETTTDLAPNTNLPNPSSISGLTGLTLSSGTNELDIRADGTVFSRIKVVWNLSNDMFISSGGQVEIQYKKTSDAEWRVAGLVPGTANSYYILDVKDKESYDVRIRGFTSLAQGAWNTVSNHLVKGKDVPPTTPTGFAATVTEKGINFTWNQIPDLDLSYYELRVGASWGAGTAIYKAKANAFLYQTLAAGSYSFWIRAIDTSLNESGVQNYNITIANPGPVTNLQGSSIAQSVKLTWGAPGQTSFPVNKYKVYKGATFGGAVLIGEVSGTVFITTEQNSGNATYWVVPIDAFGNAGTETSVLVFVDSLPFLTVLTDQILTANLATLTNCVAELDGSYSGPLNTTQNFSTLFSSNSWTTWNDKTGAGFNVWGTPSNSMGSIQWQIDYGSTIELASISGNYVATWASGSGTVSPSIAYSLDGSSWTTVSGQNVIGSSFRYVRFKLDITANTTASYVNITNPRLFIEVTKTTETGVVAAVSTDASGTLIVFKQNFIDIFEDSIQLTPKGNSPRYFSYTITGNSVRVFLWDTAGSRVSGDVAFAVEGIIAKI